LHYSTERDLLINLKLFISETEKVIVINNLNYNESTINLGLKIIDIVHKIMKFLDKR